MSIILTPKFGTPRKIKRYNWRPQLPDHRDHKCLISRPEAGLPPAFNLLSLFPACYNQLDVGSCTGNAWAGEIEHQLIAQKLPQFTPSRLFIYYGERSIEGTVGSDAGASLRDGVKVISKAGVPPETIWPYDPTKVFIQPSPEAYASALNNLAVKYAAVTQNLNAIKSCLVAGYGVVFGFTVYESFESAVVSQTGIMPMPGANEEVLGGHAVVCIGYDDSKNAFLIRNSWGTQWGTLGGHFWMPYDYMDNPDLCDDHWILEQIK